MGKDPAFLFYSNDFLTGVADLTMEERGQYITLLSLQHQKGCLSQKAIKIAVPNISKDVLAKFKIDKDGNYFNERLRLEAKKRAEHSRKQKERALKGWEKRKANESQMKATADATALPLEDEDVNEDLDITEFDINKETDFDIFWKAYDYNVGLRQVQQQWTEILKEMPNEIPKILEHVPKYVKAKPEKKFRKKPENYLKERVWMDEIVDTNKPKEEDSDRYFWKKNWNGDMVMIDRHAL